MCFTYEMSLAFSAQALHYRLALFLSRGLRCAEPFPRVATLRHPGEVAFCPLAAPHLSPSCLFNQGKRNK